MRIGIRSARVDRHERNGLRISISIEIENTHPNLKNDEFEFSPQDCALDDNFGNHYRPIPSSVLVQEAWLTRSLYPRERRAIDVAFDHPVLGVQWLVFSMVAPSRQIRQRSRLNFGIPASLIKGLEQIGLHGTVASSGDPANGLTSARRGRLGTADRRGP